MKYLIPPSEGKTSENLTNIQFKDSKYKFNENVQIILNKLKLIKDSELVKLYGVKKEKVKHIHAINININEALCTPAISRYSGVVFSNISYETFNSTEREFFNEHFLIFSGLFGMVSPFTLIPNYKLKMNVLRLYKFWNSTLTMELKKENQIIDLLPKIHKKAYIQNQNCINIDFVIVKDGLKKPAGHFGKAIKGKFIQYICKNQITRFEDLIQFTEDGFKWDGNSFIKYND